MPNQLTLRRYGRYRTTYDGDSGQTASGQMRGCVFNAASADIWVTKFGAFLGRASGSNPVVRLALYSTNSSMNPTSRVGYSNQITVTNLAGSSPETQSYTAAIAVADNAPTNSACKLQSGNRYAIAYLGTGNTVVHSMVQAANITADNEQFYNRSGLSQPPPNPFGAYTASTEGHLTAWVEGWENVPPEVPQLVAPLGTIQETAPNFVGNFRDLNGAYGASSGNGVDTGDRMAQYHIQVRQVGQATLLWDTVYSASSSEQTNNQFNRAYGGSALSRGTTYEWRARTSDQFGAWGAWSAWTQFTPANLGLITLDGSPTGKIETIQPDFQARWTHQSGLAMDACEIRLENQSGLILQTSPTIAKSVASSAAPGTLFTITWAETGFSNLSWGTAYQYRVRGRDTNGQWSDWSAPRAFNTNAAPSVPASLAPANNTIVTARPLLTCTVTDPDDTVSTGLTVKARIKNDSGSILQTRVMTYNATTGRWEYQTTSADLASYAFYRWDAYAGDGTLWSGEATAEANAVPSAEARFQYAQGPTVSVTSPVNNGTVGTTTPTIQWSVPSGGPQAKYRVRIYPDNGATPLYDTGWVTSTSTSHVVPSGYLQNETPYDLIVSVENSTGLQGDSSLVNFTVSLTPPSPPSNVVVAAVVTGLDLAASTVRITWDQTTIPSGEFVEYTIRRWAASGPDTTPIVLARITNPATTAFEDYLPAHGVVYTYAISQTSRDPSNILLQSAEVTGDVSVTIRGVVLCAVGGSGETYRVTLRGIRDRSYRLVVNEMTFDPVVGSRRTPVTFRGPARYQVWSFAGVIIDDDVATAVERVNQLLALHGADTIVCYRDNFGRKLFGRLTDVTIDDEIGGYYQVSVEMREETYSEGV